MGGSRSSRWRTGIEWSSLEFDTRSTQRTCGASTARPRETQAAAAQSRLVIDGALVGAAGGINSQSVGAHHTVLHGRLRDRSVSLLPWLVAIADNAETRLPGHGLFQGERSMLNMSDPSHKAGWEAMVKEVFATNWPRFGP